MTFVSAILKSVKRDTIQGYDCIVAKTSNGKFVFGAKIPEVSCCKSFNLILYYKCETFYNDEISKILINKQIVDIYKIGDNAYSFTLKTLPQSKSCDSNSDSNSESNSKSKSDVESNSEFDSYSLIMIIEWKNTNCTTSPTWREPFSSCAGGNNLRIETDLNTGEYNY